MQDFKKMAVNIHIHAHQNDADFETALSDQMRIFERNKQIMLSYSTRITAGEIIEDTILNNINKAEILVLLMSSNFLNEDVYFTGDYLSYYETFKKNKALIPVYCSACNWEYVKVLSGLKCIPADGKPIGRPIETKEAEFHIVSKDIYTVVCRIRQENQEKEKELLLLKESYKVLYDRIDYAFKTNDISALEKISFELPDGNDEILNEIIDYIEILTTQSENL